MADFDHSDFGGAYDAPLRSTFSTVLNWIGAALSLALIAGLGYWAYQLIVRDVTGVPVVRALEGPMRIAPEDPGGSTAAYQGLAVNAIAAEGTAAAPADTLVLAPAEVNLTEEDRRWRRSCRMRRPRPSPRSRPSRFRPSTSRWRRRWAKART
jgi:hypothetical protein